MRRLWRGVLLRSQVPKAALAAWGGNHRTHCKPAPMPAEAAAASSAPAPASSRAAAVAAAAGVAGNDGDPAHPCPICLENEDDHGKYTYGQCFRCGPAAPAATATWAESGGQIKNCPTCRAPLRVSAAVNVERLLRLVARPPGCVPVAQYNLGATYAVGIGVRTTPRRPGGTDSCRPG